MNNPKVKSSEENTEPIKKAIIRVLLLLSNSINTIVIDFDLTLSGLEPTIYRSRYEHVLWRSNSINTIVIDFDLTLPGLEPTIYRSRDEHV
jgi:phosphoglycolate phosphatase-like HAD superfamily hydrolase